MAVVRRGMRDQRSGWRGLDADEMDDVGRGNHARGMFAARGSGVGSDFQHKSPVETIRCPAWVLIVQVLGIMVDGSNPEDGVRKGAAGRAIEPGQS